VPLLRREDVTLINKNILSLNLNKFFLEVVLKIKDNQHILLIPRLQLGAIDGQIISIAPKIEINNLKGIKDTLLTFLLDRVGLISDSYKNIPISKFIFSYGIREGKITPILAPSLKTVKFHNYYKNKLPLGLKPEDYGKVILKNKDNYIIFLNKKVIINLMEEKEDSNSINRVTYIKNGEILFSWKDTIISPDKIIRYIGKSMIHFDGENVELFKVLKKTTGITTKIIPKNNKVSNKFITMDIETVMVENKHIPYLLCWYDGKKTYNYFITDFINKNQFKLKSHSASEGLPTQCRRI
jgi:hypothetical protein